MKILPQCLNLGAKNVHQRSGKIFFFSFWAEILEKLTFSEMNESDDIVICGKG